MYLSKKAHKFTNIDTQYMWTLQLHEKGNPNYINNFLLS